MEGHLFDAFGNVTRLDATSIPLGIDPDVAFPCPPARVPQPGHTVLLFTDGRLEANSPDGSYFGVERVLAVARATQSQTAAEMARAHCQAVRNFSRDRLQSDDITLVVIQARLSDRHA